MLGALAAHPLVGLVFGLLGGTIYWLVAKMAADKYVLDVYDSELLESVQAPRLYEMLRDLATDAGIEMPIVHKIPLNSPNAFVITRGDRPAIFGVSCGLTEELDREEVRAIVALMVARVATGAARAWTVGSALAGIPLHPPRIEDVVDADLSVKHTGFGQQFRSLMCPVGALYTKSLQNADVVTQCDQYAAELLGSTSTLESALRKLHVGRLPVNDSTRPAETATAMLFATPVYVDATDSPTDVHTTCLAGAASDVVSVEHRIDRLQQMDSAALASRML